MSISVDPATTTMSPLTRSRRRPTAPNGNCPCHRADRDSGWEITPGKWKSSLGMPIPKPPRHCLNYRVTWTPDGQGLQERNDQTDWYALHRPVLSTRFRLTGLRRRREPTRSRVRDPVRRRQTRGLRWSEVATGQAAAPTAPTNSAATGQPTITGTVEVGETLTAATSAISDGNGTHEAWRIQPPVGAQRQRLR